MNQPDFIVIGAGSAGCILALRLARDFGATVTLIEAPSQPAPMIDQERPVRWMLEFLHTARKNTCESTPSMAPWPRNRGKQSNQRDDLVSTYFGGYDKTLRCD